MIGGLVVRGLVSSLPRRESPATGSEPLYGQSFLVTVSARQREDHEHDDEDEDDGADAYVPIGLIWSPIAPVRSTGCASSSLRCVLPWSGSPS
jgi:hypothetical protein